MLPQYQVRGDRQYDYNILLRPLTAAAQLGRIAAHGSASAEVTVTRGAGTPIGDESLVADITSKAEGVAMFTTTALTLVGTPPAPRGEARVSSLEFLQADNGWGPVERNLSNGEQDSGDGQQLTIGGQTYEHGIGVHAEALVAVYAGQRCTSFTAEVGVDDETGDAGSMIFEVYADDRLVATSPRASGAGGPMHLEADVTGATIVKLRATEAADGNAYDHGDWANAILRCAS